MANLAKGETITDQEIFVIKNLTTPLLGRPAIQALKILELKFLDEVTGDSHMGLRSHKELYPKVFDGLGKMKGDYGIKPKHISKFQPVALSTARPVPVAYLDRVKEELEQMASTGIISKIFEATDWCSGMVVVPKKDGGIRICVDLTNLSRAVKREYHPINAVDYTLSSLRGAKYFSRLNAIQGLWQIKLHESSR